MPSRLAPAQQDAQRQERALAEQYLARLQAQVVKAPWEGFVPDLPHNLVGFNGCLNMSGLVVRPDPQSSGEILTTDGGWTPVDLPRLGANLPSLAANSSKNVVRLRNFPLVTAATHQPSGSEDTQTILLVSGDGATAGTFQMYRLDPASSHWTVIAFSVVNFAGATAPSGTIDGDTVAANSYHSMADSCVFALGAPARAGGNINQPAFLWTNNIDPVMIYPRVSGTLEFGPLSDVFSLVATTGDFRCASLCTFKERVYFLNTFEVGVRYRNRLRRSARDTADPTTANLGAGHIDLEQFNGYGVAIRPLGDVMVAYFTDGVAFIRDTGDQAVPNAVQVLDVSRSLLSTHAVVSISDNKHFGIFDDGWWILDASGRWQQVGLTAIENKPLFKWKSSFYGQLNRDKIHRIQCKYDPIHNWVRIAFPTSNTDVTEVWNYDIAADRVFPDSYADGITVWGDVITYSNTSPTWDSDAVDIGWDDILNSGSWDSETAAGALVHLAHGNQVGLVYSHDDNLLNRNGTVVPWLYGSSITDLNHPAILKCSRRLLTEYINSANTNSVTFQFTNGTNTTSAIKTMNSGVADESRFVRAWGRLAGEHLGFILTGAGQVRMRQFQFEWWEDGRETLDP